MELTRKQKCDRYIENLRTVRTISKPQFAPETAPDVLLEEIQGNAIRCFEMMKENNRLLDELIYARRPEELDDDEIADLTEFAGRLFNYSNSEDSGIAYKIHELLLKVARLRGDEAMLIKELYFCGVSLHYINIRDDDHGVNMLGPRVHAYFWEGAQHIAEFEVSDTETRQYIIRCVGNTRLATPRKTKEECWRYDALFEQAMHIIESPYYQNIDPKVPWDKFIYTMHMDRMTLLPYLRENKDQALAEKVLASATYVYNHQKANQNEESRLQNWRIGYYYHSALYHAGKGTVRAVVEDMLNMINEAGETDYSPSGINRNLTAAAYITNYEVQLPEADRIELAPCINKMRKRVRKYLDRMPPTEYPRVASYSIRELLAVQSDTMMDNFGLLGTILAGHKPTFVHSTMVAHLTQALIRRLLETKPESLIGLMNCRTVEELQTRKEEILRVAYSCGLYHDVGKSAVIMYIDTNSRRLLDEEFLCVQCHPVVGYGLLCDAGYEEYLAQAARYHHCFYNGKGGYPGDVPPCPERVKAIVDALTVADSLDAATDNIGRCYNMAKPFRTLVGELRAQSGTRYAPYVVELFQDEGFCDWLAEKLDEKRKAIYLQVYQMSN